jgi:F-type H+-transporting ATPase subunit gamma
LEQLETIKRRISSSQELRTIVKNMKSLAAVYIRFFQQAARAVDQYRESLYLGFRAYFAAGGDTDSGEAGEDSPGYAPPARGEEMPGVVLIGSEQGMCGNFNEKLMEYLDRFTGRLPNAVPRPRLAAVGSRIHQPAAESPYSVDENFRLPTSPEQIAGLVDRIILFIGEWRTEYRLNSIYLIHNTHGEENVHEPKDMKLFPLDRRLLEQWSEEPWEGKTIPLVTMNRKNVFKRLIDHFIYAQLFRGFVESMESENAARLASMEAAEKNIQDKLTELQNQYNVRRQQAITSELLDMVGGFEALSE